jgi:hypothetical protein
METQVRTPNAIFGQPQRFLVPLFQRPYVWNEEQQWEPLWRDLERVAFRLLKDAHTTHQPHFLGAVVLQQVQTRVGELQARIIIDGQQRLTTLQLLLDALHAELHRIDAVVPAGRLEYLIENDGRFCKNDEDRYKVWPTNRDRPAFNEVMSAPHPIDYGTLNHPSARLVEAHRFFSERAKEWLNVEGEEQCQRRAEALERSARELLQLVIIDLSIDENAQEIFETLNARGAQLTAADLIKNFIFQKLLEDAADVEKAYETHWREFETGFWETEVSAGRLRHQRSSLFLNHWLISRCGEEIVAREVFSTFKFFAEHEANVPMDVLLQQISQAAQVYRRITEAADNVAGEIDRIGLFGYRINAMESDVMKSVLLALLNQERPPVPDTVINSSLDIIESWLTRRMLVRAPTKGYNQVAAEMVGIIRQTEATRIDQALRSYLMSQTAETKYWPDDDEVRTELADMPIYRKISRARLRMVLEAIEDHRRGYRPGGSEYAGMRVPRDGFWIEHIMPQAWDASWPPPTEGTVHDRAQRIHTLGNLTLLTAKLNTAVSNGPWAGENGKKVALRQHDLLLLNRDLDCFSSGDWTDDAINRRTANLIDRILEIWSVPPGYKASAIRSTSTSFHSVDLSDLLSAGLLAPGATIVPSSPKLRERKGQILPDGRIDIDGHIFDTPSGAGYHIRKRPTNGWSFWLVDAKTKKSLASLRREYLENSSISANGVDNDDEDKDSMVETIDNVAEG